MLLHRIFISVSKLQGKGIFPGAEINLIYESSQNRYFAFVFAFKAKIPIPKGN